MMNLWPIVGHLLCYKLPCSQSMPIGSPETKTNQPRTYLRLPSGSVFASGRLAILAVVFSIGVAAQSRFAIASCGDYLQHTQGGSLLLGNLVKDATGHSTPTPKCRNGNCGSQDSVPLPSKSQFRIKQDRPDMNLAKHGLPSNSFMSSRLTSDEFLLFEPALDVAEPPPRHAA
jgi:hypothetical protein